MVSLFEIGLWDSNFPFRAAYKYNLYTGFNRKALYWICPAYWISTKFAL